MCSCIIFVVHFDGEGLIPIDPNLEYAEEEGRGGLGTVVVQAAGNDNCDISNDGILAHETVVAVAAIGATDEQESYSSYGDPIDIAAPSGGGRLPYYSKLKTWTNEYMLAN